MYEIAVRKVYFKFHEFKVYYVLIPSYLLMIRIHYNIISRRVKQQKTVVTQETII